MDEQQLQQQIIQLVLAAMSGDQQAAQQIQQIMQAAQQGDELAAQLAQMIQAVMQQMQGQQAQAAKFGAKLNYIRHLNGNCPRGYKMQYYKQGGRLCKSCIKVKNSVTDQYLDYAKCGKKMRARKALNGVALLSGSNRRNSGNNSYHSVGGPRQNPDYEDNRIYDGGELPPFTITVPSPSFLDRAAYYGRELLKGNTFFPPYELYKTLIPQGGLNVDWFRNKYSNGGNIVSAKCGKKVKKNQEGGTPDDEIEAIRNLRQKSSTQPTIQDEINMYDQEREEFRKYIREQNKQTLRNWRPFTSSFRAYNDDRIRNYLENRAQMMIGGMMDNEVRDGGELPEVTVTPDDTVYEGGVGPEIYVTPDGVYGPDLGKQTRARRPIPRGFGRKSK